MATGYDNRVKNVRAENNPENCCEFTTPVYFREKLINPSNYRILWPVNYADDKQMATTSPHEKTYSWKTKLCEERAQSVGIVFVVSFHVDSSRKVEQWPRWVAGTERRGRVRILDRLREWELRGAGCLENRPAEESDIITFVFQIGVRTQVYLWEKPCFFPREKVTLKTEGFLFFPIFKYELELNSIWIGDMTCVWHVVTVASGMSSQNTKCHLLQFCSQHNIKPSANQANKNNMPIIKTRYFRLLLSYKVGSEFWEGELREKTEDDSWKRDSWEKPLCATKTDRRTDTDRHCDTIKLL